MNIVLDFLINFIIVFILVLLLYYFFIIKKKLKKGYSKLKANDEVLIFVNRFNINVEKVGFKRIAYTIAIINSFIIAFASSIIINIDSFIWSVLICFVVILALIYSLYELTGKYMKKYEKKGEKEKCTTQKKSKKNGKNIG